MTTSLPSTSQGRLRLTFAKKAQIKYISHLDLALAWERALRRAAIPLVYSQGFNPRPKIQIASGLPLGTTGRAELIDIIISPPLEPQQALQQIRRALPAGLVLHKVEAVPLNAPSLQNLLRQADYQVWVETNLPHDELDRRVAALWAAETLIQPRQRRGNSENIDIRPWLHDLKLIDLVGDVAHLAMRLTAGQFGNLRPETVLAALDLADQGVAIERIRLIFADPD
jgi:radical SAM-linked protein